MTQITLEEAQLRLPELIAELQPGEEVQIVAENRAVARLIAEVSPTRKPRQPGSAVGTFVILSDDDEHLQDFSDYMP
jgi:antitoxin (DNA-binding transcriptional repressor) of toxin-antitoxin stability system